jgi:hypothetical protein
MPGTSILYLNNQPRAITVPWAGGLAAPVGHRRIGNSNYESQIRSSPRQANLSARSFCEVLLHEVPGVSRVRRCSSTAHFKRRHALLAEPKGCLERRQPRATRLAAAATTLKPEVVVVGGGLAGLGAARTLMRAGTSVCLSVCLCILADFRGYTCSALRWSVCLIAPVASLGNMPLIQR